MSTIATGVFKRIAFKKQSGLGSPATGSGGQYLRRTESTIDLKKASFQSAEILVSQQVQDMRHGVRSVAGTIKGELSVGGYQPFMESVCRQVVQDAATTGAKTDITAAVTTAPAGTFTRGSGSFLTDGFKIGDVVRWTGFTSTGAGNNNVNFLIIGLTATVMTVTPLNASYPVKAVSSGDSVTCTVAGKKTWVPTSGQTRDYYSIEHWFGDVAQSELFTDCVIGGVTVTLPASGMATVEFPVMGLNMTTDTAQQLTSPTAAPIGGIEASVNGAVIVNGTKVATVTDMSIKLDGGYSLPGGMVGSNVDPDVFPGVVKVTGSMSVFFENATLRDLFLNETEFNIVVALTANNNANADFTSFVMSRVKATDAAKDDTVQGLKQTIPFTALENINGGAALADLDTTISIQDSAFA